MDHGIVDTRKLEIRYFSATVNQVYNVQYRFHFRKITYTIIITVSFIRAGDILIKGK